MATTYTWHVNTIECVSAPGESGIPDDCDIISSVMWTLSGDDGNNTTMIAGRTQLDIDLDPGHLESNNESYLALSEANVISMIQTTLGANNIDGLHSQIDANLRSANSFMQQLPWV